MNKPAYLGPSILELSKIIMYEFWYGYVKPKYGEKAKLCYMDTDSFIVTDILLPKGKSKKVTGLMKDELGAKITTKFVRLRAKAYSYLIDDRSEDITLKGTEKKVIKRKLKFENFKNYLEATQLENKINYPEKIKITIDSFKKIISNSWETISQY